MIKLIVEIGAEGSDNLEILVADCLQHIKSAEVSWITEHFEGSKAYDGQGSWRVAWFDDKTPQGPRIQDQIYHEAASRLMANILGQMEGQDLNDLQTIMNKVTELSARLIEIDPAVRHGQVLKARGKPVGQ